MTAAEVIHAYRITHSTIPTVAVGSIIADKADELDDNPRRWNWMDLTTGDYTGFTGVIVGRFCGGCEELNHGGQFGHEGPCGEGAPLVDITPAEVTA